mgnify:CR=1 FL=1
MATLTFTKATRYQLKARVGLIGPSGSGKTYTSLLLAKGLGGKVAVIDTENRSASKYASEPEMPDFDVLELEEFSPQTYVKAIHAAEEAGYDVLIIDSLSHGWMGKGGALEQVDKAAARSQGNKFVAWRDVTPHHNALVDAMVRCKFHLIVTMRAKTEYVIEENEKGKKVPRKIGIQPIQRDGLEYEFDVVGDMDADNRLVVSKSRCKALTKAVINEPGLEMAQILKTWLSSGAPPAPSENGNGNGHVESDKPGRATPTINLKDAKTALQTWAVNELGFNKDNLKTVIGAAVKDGSLPEYTSVQEHDQRYRDLLTAYAKAQGWIETPPAKDAARQELEQPAPDDRQMMVAAHKALLWEKAQEVNAGFQIMGQMVGYLLDCQIAWEEPANWDACMKAFRERTAKKG